MTALTGELRPGERTAAESPAVAWQTVCTVDEVPAGLGVAAVIGGRQIAIFRTDDGRCYALENRDPFCGANVLSRGIVGSRGEIPVVASPMLKNVFDLRTGCSVDRPEVSVATYPVRQAGVWLEVGTCPP